MRRVPAILMVLFLVCPLFFAALTTISVSTWALSRSFYAEILGNIDLYQIPDTVSSATWSARDVPGLEGLSFRTSARAMREILSPAYMRSQAVGVLNQVFDVLGARGRSEDITVDLAPVKAALLGEQGKRFALALARDLPVSAAASGFAVGPGRLPLSRPSSLSVERAAEIIAQGLPAFTRGMPDSVRMSDADYGWHWRPTFPLIGVLVMADVLLLLFAGGIWTAAAFVGGATRFERLQWLGWSLFAPAAGVCLMGLAVVIGGSVPWMQWGIESARLSTHGFTASFTAALIDTAHRVVARVGIGFLAVGAIAGGGAMGLLAWSWSIPEQERKSTEA
jgi:hypothetical protein